MIKAIQFLNLKTLSTVFVYINKNIELSLPIEVAVEVEDPTGQGLGGSWRYKAGGLY